MARTMTDEQEREIHVYCEAANPAYIGKKLLAELDAERAAHAETKAKLALAEAVCGPANEVMDKLLAHGPSIVPHLVDTDDNAGQRLREALAARRAAK